MKAFFVAAFLSILPAVVGIGLVVGAFHLVLKTQHRYPPAVAKKSHP